jgi:hypothetical protein
LLARRLSFDKSDDGGDRSVADERFINDPNRPPLRDDEFAARRDTELQPDPELDEGPASTGRMTLLAVVIALVLGAVFYGLNNTHMQQAGTAPPAQTAQTQSPSPAPAANNSQPGTTTGSATNRPSAPQAAPKAPDAEHSSTPSSGSRQ